MKPSASYPKLATLVLATSAVVMLSGCGAMLAQNPSSSFTPVNAVAAEPESRLLLKGADVVAYFIQGQYVQGSPEFRSQ
ncbi:MAG: hypothetical protein Q8M78_06835, partial [Burkholderiaceae bacterium]|nr:hypothetical protein [Burkholderiaceae bacterium]